MGGCFCDGLSPIFILSGIWNFSSQACNSLCKDASYQPALRQGCLSRSTGCAGTGHDSAESLVPLLMSKSTWTTTPVRSFAERKMVLPRRRFEGPTVFSAKKDDRPETATASLSSPCTTSGAKLLFAPTAAAPSVHWSGPATWQRCSIAFYLIHLFWVN